jgi:DNA-binding MarR family transcriptional regulator
MAAPADEMLHAKLPAHHDEHDEHDEHHEHHDRHDQPGENHHDSRSESHDASDDPSHGPSHGPSHDEGRDAAAKAAPGAPITDEEYSDLGRTVGQLLHRVMRARQENDGGGTAVLGMLAKCGPVRASDLAKELFLDLSTVSRHVQHLERDGLIERAPDPRDRRATTLHLTALGRKHLDDFWQRKIEAMREGLDDWDPEEMRTLLRLLRRYVEDYVGKNVGRGPGTSS